MHDELPWPGAQSWVLVPALPPSDCMTQGIINLWGFYWLTHKEATVPADQCVRSPVFITQAPVWMHVSVYFSWRQEKTLIFASPFLMEQQWSLSHSQVEAFSFFQPPSHQEGNQPSEHFRLYDDGGFLLSLEGSGHPTIYGKMRGAASPFWTLRRLQWLEKTEYNVFQLLMMGRCWIAEWESLGSGPCLLSYNRKKWKC